ncbi:adenylate/guanylate cyclase domain-containing protein [Thermoleptolyngbya sichuanensis A183]|uniref:Adenylate/guanylate cyclase domain-containing protein n=1 Tax=Thermoleptolyngbya sichuanensis A183 TaxID=2737172 RepID=A0A6M8BEN7_9CYAN|nr:adenylate/guanylate cyclase domain-containing protein [Thermoleptolyngbya sichuanensis]QKD82706.1 adenylate/guanylate cyclase domain-containing protein [Thermoleptolyngbya sichuanensis A183]
MSTISILGQLNRSLGLSKSGMTDFLAEFLGNSGHFLILKSLSDITLDGWQSYFSSPAEYLLIFAMCIQTAYLSRANASRIFGNLIGVSIYTLVDLPYDGLIAFFQEPSHTVFWIFSISISLLEGIYCFDPIKMERWIIPLKSIFRMLMLLSFYSVVRLSESQNYFNFNRWLFFQELTGKRSHLFLMGGMLVVGLLLGIRQLQVTVQERQLKQTNSLLNRLARWGMGNYAVNAFIADRNGLSFEERERAILFMDIRGFTSWCEQNQPQVVAEALNQYYQQIEPVAVSFNPLRISFTADEVMAIYRTPEQAVSAALAMQNVAKVVLSPYGLGAGCAVHYGSVIEGLFGGDDVRTYTVIGDVVNTAKRLESSTAAGDITISDAVYKRLHGQISVKTRSDLALKLKGKMQSVKTWVLLE